MPPLPFTLASVREIPGVIVPEEAVRAYFAPSLVELEQILERIADTLEVIIVGTPPPKRDAVVREDGARARLSK